jgi:UDPglucose 6-dehydrogenase
MNDYQENRFVQTINQALFNTIANKRIALFGFAFKANTSDTRESPAFYITKKLLEEKANVVISDPKALGNAKIDLKGYDGNVEYEEDPYKAADKAHAVAVLTEWDIYNELDYEKIYNNMEKPSPLGKPHLIHFKEA